MKTKFKINSSGGLGPQGFSLIELMIVVAIVGILAMAAGFYLNSNEANFKSFAFNLKTRFHQAQAEAVKRGSRVYLDFDLDNDGTLNNGFTIWEEGLPDGDSYNVADGDSIIDTVVFENKVSGSSKHGPEIYDGSAASPTGGPEDDGPGTSTIGDGVKVAGGINRFSFRQNGESASGSVYFYFPQGPDAAKEVELGPVAIIVNNVGRIRIVEWKTSPEWP